MILFLYNPIKSYKKINNYQLPPALAGGSKLEKEKALAKLSIGLKPFIHKLIPPAKAGGNSKKNNNK